MLSRAITRSTLTSTSRLAPVKASSPATSAYRTHKLQVDAVVLPAREHLSHPTPTLSPLSHLRILAMAPTEHKAGRPIIISGPSGSGKSTILKRLFDEYPERFAFSVSHTTRAPRGQEQNGVEYHFVSKDEFERMIGEKGFVEYAQFGSNYYGTSLQTIEDQKAKGRTTVLDIEMNGVKQIAAHPNFEPKPRFLFLSPPSEEILEQRLRGRGTDAEEAIQKRLKQAKEEMKFQEENPVGAKRVINDDLDRAYKEVKEWVNGSD